MINLQDAINDFLNHCHIEKVLNSKTLKAYKIDLTQLLSFVESKEGAININSITKAELRVFLKEISHLKPKSIKRKIATVKAMFNYLEFDEKILSNPFRKIRINIKEVKALPKVMDIDEIKKILRIAYLKIDEIKSKKSYSYIEAVRNVSVIESLFATGARVSEIANLKSNNINLRDSSILIRGKGNKERVIQVCNEEALHILRLYKELVDKRISKKTDYFFINRFGNKISDQSIRILVKNISKEAGISRTITPHVFRHSFATLLLEGDVDIKYIQSLLGHSSIMTTQIYTHVNKMKQKQILETKHPRKYISMSQH
jgi:integrase/recombinase XerD